MPGERGWIARVVERWHAPPPRPAVPPPCSLPPAAAPTSPRLPAHPHAARSDHRARTHTVPCSNALANADAPYAPSATHESDGAVGVCAGRRRRARCAAGHHRRYHGLAAAFRSAPTVWLRGCFAPGAGGGGRLRSCARSAICGGRSAMLNEGGVVPPPPSPPRAIAVCAPHTSPPGGVHLTACGVRAIGWPDAKPGTDSGEGLRARWCGADSRRPSRVALLNPMHRPGATCGAVEPYSVAQMGGRAMFGGPSLGLGRRSTAGAGGDAWNRRAAKG